MIGDYPHTAHLSSLSLSSPLSPFKYDSSLLTNDIQRQLGSTFFIRYQILRKREQTNPGDFIQSIRNLFCPFQAFFRERRAAWLVNSLMFIHKKIPLELQQSELFIPSNRAHTHNNLVYHDTRTRQQCIKSSSFLSSLPSRLCRFLSCSCFLLSTHDGGIASKFF